MRLALVISSLESGGAERVMTTMANYWAAMQWHISILTLDNGSTPPFYKLDSRVRHKALGIASQSTNKASGMCTAFARTLTLRRAITAISPDAVISFMDRPNITTILATRGLKVPVVISERIDPARHSIGKAWEQLRTWTYPLAHSLVAQSEEAVRYFSPVVRSRARVIPNPVQMPPDSQRQIEKDSTPTIISVGRLDRQKGFDFLIRAFGLIKERYPDWRLKIVGEGPMRRELEELRDRLGLQHRICMPGRITSVYEALRQADIFVMASRYEGFPNALCEAMACGLPVISTDCPSGPREIIRDNIDGILVPNEDVECLAATMEELITSRSARMRLARRAPEVCERFSVEKVMQRWEQTLEEAIQCARGEQG